MTQHSPPHHPATAGLVEELGTGRIGRREFLTRATILGAGAAGACLLGGLARPARAQPAMANGGTLRIQQTVHSARRSAQFRLDRQGQPDARISGISRRISARRNPARHASAKLGGQRGRHAIRAACPPRYPLAEWRCLHGPRRGAQHRTLVRHHGTGEFHGKPVHRADRPDHGHGARGCDHCRGRPHRDAAPDASRHRADCRHGRLSRPPSCIKL